MEKPEINALETIKNMQGELTPYNPAKHLVLLSAGMSLIIFANGLIKLITKDTVDEGLITEELGNGIRACQKFADSNWEEKLKNFFQLWNKANLIGGLHCKSSLPSGDIIEYRW